MTLNRKVDPAIYTALSSSELERIVEYINDSQTATVVHDKTPGKPHKQETVTSELIYCWMIQFNIPVEFEKWHLNRLLTLIRVCEIKMGGGAGKMSKRDILRNNTAMNAKRRAARHTRG